MKLTTLISFYFISLTSSVISQISEKNCFNNEDCKFIDKNMICLDKICVCETGYKKKSFNSCQPVVGSKCTVDEDCENAPGSICLKNTCVCDVSFLVHNFECVKVGKKDEDCMENLQCIQRFNDDNYECDIITKKCICKAGFHQNSAKKCIESRYLADSCVHNENCFLKINNENVLKCHENTCRCGDGYTEDNNTCSGSASFQVFSVTVFTAVIISIFNF